MTDRSSREDTQTTTPEERRSPRTAVLALLVCGVLPWVAIGNAHGDTTYVMGFGLVNTNPFVILTLPEFISQTLGFESLPRSLQAWPVGLICYVGALASAVGGAVFGREDPRVTGGLVLLASVAGLFVWSRFAFRTGSQAIPIAPIAFAAVAWWWYLPAFTSGLPASNKPE